MTFSRALYGELGLKLHFQRHLRILHNSRPAVLGRQAFLILLITFILGEGMLRAYVWFDPLPFFYRVFDNRWRGKPHSLDYGFPLNSRGFKDVEFQAEKAPGTYRILGIGDSFAFGIVPYSANYLTLLEQKLKGASARNVEVINMGVPGAGTSDYLAMLVNEGLDLDPDMVSVSFFIGNDFQVPRNSRKLYSYSYLVTYIRYAYKLKFGVINEMTHSGEYRDDVGPFTEEAFLEIERQRSEVFLNRSRTLDRDFDTAFLPLLRIRQICLSRGIQFSVAIIPDEIQVNPELREMLMRTFGLTLGFYDWSAPNRRLRTELEQSGIDYIDLLDDFEVVSKRTPLYRPRDTHWNMAGNALAADLLARHLERVMAR